MADRQLHPLACETITDTRPDGPILDAWARRKAAYERYNALPATDLGRPSTEEQECLFIIDAAELLLRSNEARTPAGVAAQIWCAAFHLADMGRPVDAAIAVGDLDHLAPLEADMDWGMQLTMMALRSLEAMGGE